MKKSKTFPLVIPIEVKSVNDIIILWEALNVVTKDIVVEKDSDYHWVGVKRPIELNSGRHYNLWSQVNDIARALGLVKDRGEV